MAFIFLIKKGGICTYFKKELYFFHRRDTKAKDGEFVA